MKKIMLLLVGILMCIGIFGCGKNQKTTLSNSSAGPGETESTTEVETTSMEETTSKIEMQGNGTIVFNEELTEHVERAYKTDLIEVRIKSNSNMDDVRECFILNNEIEYIYSSIFIMSKEQLDNVQPAGDYDVELVYTREIVSIPLMETDIERMDKTEMYDVCVVFRGNKQTEDYKKEVSSLLENHGIDADKVHDFLENKNFKIELQYDEIVKLNNDPLVAYISRITFGESVYTE